MTKTTQLMDMPLTAIVLDQQSLENIVEDNELTVTLQNYVSKQELEDLDLSGKAVTETLQQCDSRFYRKTDTSAAEELEQAFSIKLEKQAESCSAIGEYALAFGKSTSAIGDWSHAEGESAIASADFSHVEGLATSATGYAAHAEGDSTEAFGDFSHAEGLYSYTFADYAHAEGEHTKATGYASHAEGAYVESYESYSHAEGAFTKAAGRQTHAEGNLATAASPNSHAEGHGSIAGQAIKIGKLYRGAGIVNPETYVDEKTQETINYIDGKPEHYSTNYDSISVQYYMLFDQEEGSVGKRISDAIGTSSIYFTYDGENAEQVNMPIVTECPDKNVTVSVYGFAKLPASMMWENRIEIKFNDYEGLTLFGFVDKKDIFQTGTFFSDAVPSTTGYVDVYVLNGQIPEENQSSEDETKKTVWLIDGTEPDSHAEGYGTLAHGRASHAEGEKTRAVGSISHAEGYDTTALGHGSHVTGVHSFAEGEYSTAIGKCVNAKGDYSIAAGNCATAEHENSFVWSGKYVGHNLTAYQSKENGSFCVNPANGLNGFYIDDKNFTAAVLSAIQLMDEDLITALKTALSIN